MAPRRALLVLLVLACAACSRAPSEPSPAPPAEAAAPPAPAAVGAAEPAAAAPAPEAAVVEAAELPPGDGTAAAALSLQGETVVDPASRFRVVLAGPSRDARLLLLDAAGAAVPASEAAEVGATTTLTLAPAAALTPGGRYQLRLDGAVGRELHLGEHAYPPSRYALRAAGEPPPPPPRAPPRRKRGR